jgi:hypothetical protein
MVVRGVRMWRGRGCLWGLGFRFWGLLLGVASGCLVPAWVYHLLVGVLLGLRRYSAGGVRSRTGEGCKGKDKFRLVGWCWALGFVSFCFLCG